MTSRPEGSVQSQNTSKRQKKDPSKQQQAENRLSAVIPAQCRPEWLWEMGPFNSKEVFVQLGQREAALSCLSVCTCCANTTSPYWALSCCPWAVTPALEPFDLRADTHRLTSWHCLDLYGQVIFFLKHFFSASSTSNLGLAVLWFCPLVKSSFLTSILSTGGGCLTWTPLPQDTTIISG